MSADPHVSELSASSASACGLTEDEQMLVLVRDELYEGNWDDFVQDLQDRLAGKPHLFDIEPASVRLQETIRHHLCLIERMRNLETGTGIDLASCLKATLAGQS